MKQEKTTYSLSYIIFIIAFSIMINLLLFLIPILVNKIINLEIEISSSVIFLIIIAMGVQIALQLSLVIIKNKCMKKFRIQMCIYLYQKIFSMSYGTLIKKGTTYLVQRADAAALTMSLLGMDAVPTIFSKSAVILIILIYSLKINMFLFLIMLGITAVNMVGFYILNKKLAEKSIYMQEHIPKEREDLYQIASQVDFLKQNADNSVINPILYRHLEKIEQINMEVNTLANGGSHVIDFFNMFLQNLVLIVLTYLFLTGKNGMGDIFTVTVLMAYFVPSVMSIVAVNLNMRELKASREFILFLQANQEEDGTVIVDKISRIEMNMEQVRIQGEKSLLQKVKITARKGDVIGVIGESGSGKSTLMKSLLKYWKSDGITVNGIPLEEIQNESYRKHISYYAQTPLIITGSMEDNLNFGREPVPGVWEKFTFLRKFQNEAGVWKQEIVENGNNLSGGDKQKISLARLLADQADVIVLDEPTSSLDEETESMILDEFFGKCQEKIVFLITHRKGNLKYCNKIYQIENGQVVKTK